VSWLYNNQSEVLGLAIIGRTILDLLRAMLVVNHPVRCKHTGQWWDGIFARLPHQGLRDYGDSLLFYFMREEQA
jgi:hypothetical protein